MEEGDDAAAQTALERALSLDPRHERAQKLLKALTARE
jgi:Tfp pilus assembly protein PilF